MHEWKPVTDRIESIHKKVRDRVIQIDAERAEIVTKVYQENASVIPMLQHSRAIKAVCEQMTVRVEDDELMVGNRAKHFCGNSVEPEWTGGGWILAMVKNGAYTLKEDGLYHNPETEDLDIVIDPEDVKKLEEIDAWWQQVA